MLCLARYLRGRFGAARFERKVGVIRYEMLRRAHGEEGRRSKRDACCFGFHNPRLVACFWLNNVAKDRWTGCQ